MLSGERSAKESPLSVVFYEIHMLNHAATYLEPEILERKDHIANAWQEVYLLHYRNLIEFFSSHKPRTRKPHQSILDAADDITYLRPLTWAGRDIQEDELRPAVGRRRIDFGWAHPCGGEPAGRRGLTTGSSPPCSRILTVTPWPVGG
ncbi:MAG TPA: hypothetical protein VHN14_27125 [Kofleriaceae bacterium]|jgi:hypothetical protein|nr:hypothetical protein [Kofleriaceae bacterium]